MRKFLNFQTHTSNDTLREFNLFTLVFKIDQLVVKVKKELKGAFTLPSMSRSRQVHSTNKHSGRNHWYPSHHFDMDFKGSAMTWAKQQCLIDLGWESGSFMPKDTTPHNHPRLSQDIPDDFWKPHVPSPEFAMDSGKWPSLSAGPDTESGICEMGQCFFEVRALENNENPEWLSVVPRELYSQVTSKTLTEDVDNSWMVVDSSEFNFDEEEVAVSEEMEKETIFFQDD